MLALNRTVSAAFRGGSTRFADGRCLLRQTRWWSAWLLIAWLTLGPAAPAAGPGALPPAGTDATIRPVPHPPPADPLKLALGERLFNHRRLLHDDTLACSSCHDLRTNGADASQRITAHDRSHMPFAVLGVFNAALNFRLNSDCNFRTRDSQARSSAENPANMATGSDDVRH